jgi:hypothetical protein
MDDLIAKMKQMGNTSGKYGDAEMFYVWITTWSDSFLGSYAKQKMNNVYVHIITLPGPQCNLTSPFCTYCIAVGQGSLDHTPVIDWYSKEIKELMARKEYHCVIRCKFIINA